MQLLKDRKSDREALAGLRPPRLCSDLHYSLLQQPDVRNAHILSWFQEALQNLGMPHSGQVGFDREAILHHFLLKSKCLVNIGVAIYELDMEVLLDI